jgi:hypothetical protein
MSTRDKDFTTHSLGVPAQQMINNSLHFVFGRHVFMAKVYEVKNAIRIFDVVPGTVFNTDDGFYVLIALYNVVLRWCCVTTTSYKSTAGNYCIIPFKKRAVFF